MTDTGSDGCATIVEVLIPGPQGPGGTGNSGIGGYSVAIEDVEAGHIIVFDGEAWENRPLAADGDMTKAVYDTDDDGKVDAAGVADAVAWTGVTDKPETFPPTAHEHAVADVDGLDEALDAKAPLDSPALTGTPTAPTADPDTDTDQIATTAFVADAIAAIETDWNGVTGKPETFPPAAHEHAIADVDGLDEALDAKAPLASPALTGAPTAPTADPDTDTDQIATTAFVKAAVDAIPGGGTVDWDDIDNVPETFPPAAHSHEIAEVDGLGEALDGKADAGDIPAVPDIASVATVRAGADAEEVLGVRNTLDAHAPVALDDAPAIAVDMALGIVFAVTLGGNRTLAAPANQIAGRSGLVIVKQDGTGARTLSFATDWQFQGGVPELSTAADAVDIVAWYVEAAGTVRASFLKGA
ncbi:hypothetical protein ACUSIJ_03500 [Pseudochelatococcus sp. B33]